MTMKYEDVWDMSDKAISEELHRPPGGMGGDLKWDSAVEREAMARILKLLINHEKRARKTPSK